MNDETVPSMHEIGSAPESGPLADGTQSTSTQSASAHPEDASPSGRADQPESAQPAIAYRAEGAYQPGACNIGPAEIARRRRAGHAGVVASGTLLALLVAARAPRAARLLVALPAAGAASGYLQARLRFCAGFGMRGVYNFGDLGRVQSVEEADARNLDRARSRQIGLASLAIGAVTGLVAAILPF